jgi:hypothetical protein
VKLRKLFGETFLLIHSLWRVSFVVRLMELGGLRIRVRVVEQESLECRGEEGLRDSQTRVGNSSFGAKHSIAGEVWGKVIAKIVGGCSKVKGHNT